MNKFDIRDAQKLDKLESPIVYGKLALLQHFPITGSFDFAHYIYQKTPNVPEQQAFFAVRRVMFP